MILQAGSLIEIKPVNPRVTSREFVPFHQVIRIFTDDMSGPGQWGAQLIDGSYVVLLNAPEET